jgi:hypothetical protein
VDVNGTEIIQSSACCPIHLKFRSAQWFKVTRMNEIFEIFGKIGDAPYVLVGGNTARGKFHTVRASVISLNIVTYHTNVLLLHILSVL